MDAYVTFYGRFGARLRVANGFSFARAPGEFRDVFHRVGDRGLGERTAGFDRVFCSLHWPRHWREALPHLDDRWVLGGPFVAGWTKDRDVPASIIDGPLERVADPGAGLAGDFDPYFLALLDELPGVHHVEYASSIGTGCHWGRCTFCGEDQGKAERLERPSAGAVVLAAPERDGVAFRANLCTPAATADQLQDVLAAMPARPGLGCQTFVRPEPSVISVVRQARDLSGLTLSTGAEVLSAEALRRLGKGFEPAHVLALVAMACERGASVTLGVMDMIPDLSPAEAEEAARNVELVGAMRRQGARVSVIQNGPVSWFRREAAERFGHPVLEVDDGFRSRWVAAPEPGSPAWSAADRVAGAWTLSGVPVLKRRFATRSGWDAAVSPGKIAPAPR